MNLTSLGVSANYDVRECRKELLGSLERIAVNQRISFDSCCIATWKRLFSKSNESLWSNDVSVIGTPYYFELHSCFHNARRTNGWWIECDDRRYLIDFMAMDRLSPNNRFIERLGDKTMLLNELGNPIVKQMKWLPYGTNKVTTFGSSGKANPVSETPERTFRFEPDLAFEADSTAPKILHIKWRQFHTWTPFNLLMFMYLPEYMTVFPRQNLEKIHSEIASDLLSERGWVFEP
jgi:hypothetical protein